MAWDDVFSWLNRLAMAGWVVLWLAPRGWVVRGVAPRQWVPGAIGVVIAAVYAATMGAHFAGAGGGYGSIAEVRTLFASDPVLVAGWGHYLAFDLLVGTWLAERLDRAGVTRWLQAPVLAATFLFGPAGWLLGLATEAAARMRSHRTVVA